MSKKVLVILILLIGLCMSISMENHEKIMEFFEILIMNELITNKPTILSLFNKAFDIIGKGRYGKIYRIKPDYSDSNEFIESLAFKISYGYLTVC